MSIKINNSIEVDRHIIECISTLETSGDNPIGCTLDYGCNPVVINHNHVFAFAKLADRPFTKTFSGGFSTVLQKKGRKKNERKQ